MKVKVKNHPGLTADQIDQVEKIIGRRLFANSPHVRESLKDMLGGDEELVEEALEIAKQGQEEGDIWKALKPALRKWRWDFIDGKRVGNE